MNQSQFVRKIDELGRFVIPIEIRKILDINEKDSLGISLSGDGIYIKKEKPSCVFCNSKLELKSFFGKNICKSCIEKIK